MNVETDLGPFVSLLLNSLLLRSLETPVNAVANVPGNAIPQNFIRELRIIVLLCENMQKFGHRFGKMFKIRKILDDRSLRSCSYPLESLSHWHLPGWALPKA